MSTPFLAGWADKIAEEFAPIIVLERQGSSSGPKKAAVTPINSTFREPRIRYIAETLANLQSFIPLPRGRRASHFGLRNLRAFRTERVSKVRWNLGALSAVCNLDCEFCYRYGSPTEGSDAVVVSQGRALLSIAETDARLSAMSDGFGLFSATADLGEDFTNPNLLEIYRKIRQHSPDQVIETTTHGGFLTEAMIRALADLKPIDLTISLNSANPEVRKAIMRDRNPQVAIAAPALMGRYGLHYSVSIVAWPRIPLSDLEATVRFADANSARAIRVQLPGRSRFHPAKLNYDRELVWQDVVALLRGLRGKLETPIYWQPYLYCSDPIIPEISGCFRGSPAAESGLKPGDIIERIDGKTVGSRESARTMLVLAEASDTGVELMVRRNEACFSVRLREEARHRAAYPYCGEGYQTKNHCFGVLINQGLHVPSVVSVALNAKAAAAQRCLVISSPLMEASVRRVFEALSARIPDLPMMDVIAPKARFFGGDIILGDLLVFEDILQAVREHEIVAGHYDRIAIPETMIESGTDLNGKTFDSFNTSLDGRCVLVYHPRILD